MKFVTSSFFNVQHRVSKPKRVDQRKGSTREGPHLQSPRRIQETLKEPESFVFRAAETLSLGILMSDNIPISEICYLKYRSVILCDSERKIW